MEPFDNVSEVTIGQVLAAVHPNEGIQEEFHRAKVIDIEKNKETRKITYDVIFRNLTVLVAISTQALYIFFLGSIH